LPKLANEQTEPFSGSAVLFAEGSSKRWRFHMGKGALLWLIGIPLPIILVIWLFGGLG